MEDFPSRINEWVLQENNDPTPPTASSTVPEAKRLQIEDHGGD